MKRRNGGKEETLKEEVYLAQHHESLLMFALFQGSGQHQLGLIKLPGYSRS